MKSAYSDANFITASRKGESGRTLSEPFPPFESKLGEPQMSRRYPYLDFTAAEKGEEYRYDGIDEPDDEGYRNYLDDDDGEYRPTFKLKNGQIAAGDDCSGEFHLDGPEPCGDLLLVENLLNLHINLHSFTIPQL
jgi:hypothetical protein